MCWLLMSLQVIFVESINNGVFQEKTNIVPEHKREDESVAKNYCSITSYF